MAVASNDFPDREALATLSKVVTELRAESIMMRGIIAFLAAQIVRLSPDQASAEAAFGGHFMAFAQATGRGFAAGGAGCPADLTMVAEKMTEWLEHYGRSAEAAR